MTRSCSHEHPLSERLRAVSVAHADPLVAQAADELDRYYSQSMDMTDREHILRLETNLAHLQFGEGGVWPLYRALEARVDAIQEHLAVELAPGDTDASA